MRSIQTTTTLCPASSSLPIQQGLEQDRADQGADTFFFRFQDLRARPLEIKMQQRAFKGFHFLKL